MPYSVDIIEELQILTLYNLANAQEGLKFHNSAEPTAIAAALRLHNKGLISLPDGGYLTTLGIQAAGHAQSALNILNT